MPDCTSNRVPETHVWPEAMKDAKAARFTAEGMSASSKTMIGAWFFHQSAGHGRNSSPACLATELSGKGRQVPTDDASQGAPCFSTCLDMRLEACQITNTI
jgi:hypothetical protein